MNNVNHRFRSKIIQSLLLNQKQKGFTLIELLVVIIIIGVLAAISLPNYIGQIGKARETEAKTNLGAISRSQQAYHFEKQTFADAMNKLELSGTFKSKYYTFPDPATATGLVVKHKAMPIIANKDQVRNYASGVYYNAGLFEIILCQGKDIGEDVDVPDNPSGACTNGGIKLQ